MTHITLIPAISLFKLFFKILAKKQSQAKLLQPAKCSCAFHQASYSQPHGQQTDLTHSDLIIKSAFFPSFLLFVLINKKLSQTILFQTTFSSKFIISYKHFFTHLFVSKLLSYIQFYTQIILSLLRNTIVSIPPLIIWCVPDLLSESKILKKLLTWIIQPRAEHSISVHWKDLTLF